MERESIMKQIIAAYLSKNHTKFHNSREVFMQEAATGEPSDIAQRLLDDFDTFCTYHTITKTYSIGDTVDRYEECYSRLKNFVHQSLDLYKPELSEILYPIFISLFLTMIDKDHVTDARSFFNKFRGEHEPLHTEEMERVKAVSSSQHIYENPVAVLFFKDKYTVNMSKESADLLVSFILENDLLPIFRLMNKTIHLKISKTSPNDGPLYLRRPSATPSVAPFRNWPKTVTEIITDKFDLVPDPNNDKILQPQKKARSEAMVDDDAVPLPKLDEGTELKIIKEISKKVQLSATAKPSICFHTFFNTRSSMNTTTISNDGSLVIGGFQDASIKMWDLTERTRDGGSMKGNVSSKTLLGHSGPVYACSLSPDNKFLLSSSEDATVRLWSLELDGGNLVSFKGHNYPVWDVAFSPLGLYFATASHDRTARLWSTDHISFLRIFVGHFSDVDCVCFHPNSNYVATGSTDQSLRLWDIQSGDCVRVFTGHTSPVSCCEISPDGKYLASGSEKGEVMLWDLGSSRLIAALGSHQRNTAVHSLSFSSVDATLLATGGADNTVRLWDVRGAVSGPDQNNTTATEGNVEPSSFNCGVFRTKETSVQRVSFTRANLLFAAGSYNTQFSSSSALNASTNTAAAAAARS